MTQPLELRVEAGQPFVVMNGQKLRVEALDTHAIHNNFHALERLLQSHTLHQSDAQFILGEITGVYLAVRLRKGVLRICLQDLNAASLSPGTSILWTPLVRFIITLKFM